MFVKYKKEMIVISDLDQLKGVFHTYCKRKDFFQWHAFKTSFGFFYIYKYHVSAVGK